MLAGIRAFAQTWFAKVCLAILTLSFLGWGISGRVHTGISNAVVKAGSHEISRDSFKQYFQHALQDAEKQAGQQVTIQDAVAHGFDRQVLEGLSASEAFAEYVTRMGLRPAPSLIAEALRKTPEFFDPISGKFDRKAYEQKVAQLNLTPVQYESELRDEIAQDQMATGIAAGMKAPRTYGALIAGFELEGRTLSYFVLDPHDVPQPTPPTDVQLTAFMKDNAAALTRPEMRTLTVVRFSPKALAASMPVDQAAVQKLYDFKKDTLTTPEKRTLVEVPAKDAASADAAAKRLKAGESPDAVAKTLGVTPLAYTDVLQSGVADPKVAAAAFAMKAGDVSAPIHSDLAGYPVVKLLAVKPATTPTLDAIRPQLEAQARSDAANQKAYDGVQKFDDAHGGGANLADAAKKAGFTPVTIGPVTAQGVDATGHPVQGLSQKLMKDAFTLPQGGESDIEDEGQGEYFAVRVEKVSPPSLPSLQDIKPQLTQSYMSQEMMKRLLARAQELTAQIKKGQSLEQVAAGAKLPVGHAVGITRQGMAQNRMLGRDLVEQIFQAKQGEVIAGPTAQVAVMVAHVDAVTPAPPGLAAQLISNQRTQLSGMLFQDMGQLARDTAKAKIKPTYDINLAHQALGITDDDLPKSASGAAPKGSGKAL